MSVTFSTGFHQIKPGLRVSGDEISVVFVGTYDSGLYAGKKYIHIDLTNEPDLTFVEAGVSGPLETVADVDALYTQLKDAGMTEAFAGFLIDPSDLSSISIGDKQVSFDFAGHQAYVFSRNPDAAVTTRTKVANQTWSLPQTEFAGSVALFGALEGPEEIEFVSIENRLGLLEATNGLIKDDYNFITLVGTPSPAAGQVGVTNTVPSAIDMIVLPATDVDGKTLDYSTFKDGDRIGLKQANGSTAIYSLEPSLNMGTHFRFNAELLALGYYGDQEFVFNTGVTAVIEDTSTRTSAAAVMGVGVSAVDLGTFTGATIADGSTAKAALQALESGLETTNANVTAGDAATLSSATTYTDTAITNVIGTAPGVLDTLGEIADAINDDANVYTTLVASIAAVQTDVDGNESDGDAADAALSGRLDTLEADSTTATAVAAVQADVDANETASDAAEAALSGRLDTLEADPTTATAVAAVQSDVDQNESDADAAMAGEATTRANADTALSGRLDVLEADPTTATAVAAVQSDVDQNETDSDAADAALSGRLDTLEADPTTATAVAAVQADVDQNETDGDAADAALSGRLDTLEADPTTATAVAAVQADVDQNESDADTALALKAPLADPDFTGQLEVDTNARLEFDSNLTKVHNVLRGTSIEVGNNITLKPAAADGRVEVEGEFYLRPSDMTDAANDTAAAAAGVIVGQVYRNGSQLMIRVS